MTEFVFNLDIWFDAEDEAEAQTIADYLRSVMALQRNVNLVESSSPELY